MFQFSIIYFLYTDVISTIKSTFNWYENEKVTKCNHTTAGSYGVVFAHDMCIIVQLYTNICVLHTTKLIVSCILIAKHYTWHSCHHRRNYRQLFYINYDFPVLTTFLEASLCLVSQYAWLVHDSLVCCEL